MKVRALLCACGGYKHKEFPLDHYFSGACPAPPLPYHKIVGILAGLLDDKVHRDCNITITRLLGCPKQVILEDTLYHAIKVEDFFNMHEGTREHQDAQKNAPPGHYTEVRFPVEGKDGGTLFGVKLHGTVDLLHADFSEINEYKKHAETSQYAKEKAQLKGEIDWDVAAQVGMQSLLVKQFTGHDVPNRFVWHLAMAKAMGPKNSIRRRLPNMTEEEIAAHRPGGGDSTVAQHVQDYQRYKTMVFGGMDKVQATRAMPLRGKTQYRSPKHGTNKCDLYCSARPVRDQVEGICALMPETLKGGVVVEGPSIT